MRSLPVSNIALILFFSIFLEAKNQSMWCPGTFALELLMLTQWLAISSDITHTVADVSWFWLV